MLSQMSPGVGMANGFSLGALSQPQPQQQAAPRQEEIEVCMPVCIRMLHEAAKRPQSETGNLIIHGKEVGTALMVAMVEDIVQNGNLTEILVNDSTGRLKLKHYAAEALPEEVASLRVGCYVCIAGAPRVTPSLHVSVVAIRRTRTPDEVSYHMIEVAHTGLRLQHPNGKALGVSQEFQTPSPKQAVTQAPLPARSGPGGETVRLLDYDSPPKDDGPGEILKGAREPAPAPMELSLPSSKGEEKPLPVAVSLRDAILSCLREVSTEVGLEVGALMRDLGQKVTVKASEADLRSMLHELVEEAEIVETIDANHFAIL